MKIKYIKEYLSLINAKKIKSRLAKCLSSIYR